MADTSNKHSNATRSINSPVQISVEMYDIKQIESEKCSEKNLYLIFKHALALFEITSYLTRHC